MIDGLNYQIVSDWEKDKDGKGYICPICQSGSGKNGTGITTKDGKHFTCWAGGCFTHRSPVDIFAISNGINPQDTKAVFKLAYNRYNGKTHSVIQTSRPKPAQKKDYLNDFKVWREALRTNDKAKAYLKGRGINDEVTSRFWLGYCKNLNGIECIVIPTSRFSFNARNINPCEPKDRYRKSPNASEFFNLKALRTNDLAFVVESEFDALSIESLGFCAIGLGGLANIYKLLNMTSNKHFILALDNDTKGQAKQEEVKNYDYQKHGISIYCPNLNELYGEGAKDSNEALVKNREAYKERLTEAVRLVREKAKF